MSTGTAKTEGLGAAPASAVPERQSPILTALDRMISQQEERHAWLYRAGEQIRRMNEEEAANIARESV